MNNPFDAPSEIPQRQQTQLVRIIDANANRAAEGLRVIEDFARFALDDPHLTLMCKTLRHDLTLALRSIPAESRHAARQSEQDVGAQLMVEEEYRRADARSVFLASANRLQQALRSLEEYTKALLPQVASTIEPLRYRAYQLHRALDITGVSKDRLAKVRLYVLLDGGKSSDDLAHRAEVLVKSGAHLLQLRDKNLNDRQLLQRARQLREVTKGSSTLLIINDRPDIAALSHADGVHLGQEEMSVKDARSVVGVDSLIGLSTHSLEQARQAVLDGANYIGVGPIFPSKTKHFDQTKGVELLQQVSAEISLPVFAIGGVTMSNLPEVLNAGINRIAVSAAISQEDDPAYATEQFLRCLTAGDPAENISNDSA